MVSPFSDYIYTLVPTLHRSGLIIQNMCMAQSQCVYTKKRDGTAANPEIRNEYLGNTPP